jgi:hypothetical protein
LKGAFFRESANLQKMIGSLILPRAHHPSARFIFSSLQCRVRARCINFACIIEFGFGGAM